MEWLEITVNSKPHEISGLCLRLEDLGVDGLVIEDTASFDDFLENNRQYWDYIDEELEKELSGVCRVKFYLEASEAGRRQLERLRRELMGMELLERPVRDEDWENNWKEFYKPLPVGERLIIVPEWETAPETGGREVLRLDPGLIFGTGAHPTTQMCLRSIEKIVASGDRVLDLGCGSGILAIAALILGAGEAVAVDIDPKAPDVVAENAALNGIGAERLKAFAGDVLADKALSRKIGSEKFPIVLANIVADVIIALTPKIPDFLADSGHYVCSGIIDGREEEVKSAINNAGLTVIEEHCQENWRCYVCRTKI